MHFRTKKVECQIMEDKRQYGHATAKKWRVKSPERLDPKCAHFMRCGGCQGQHIPIEMQRKAKESALFKRLSKLQSETDFIPAYDLWRCLGISSSCAFEFMV